MTSTETPRAIRGTDKVSDVLARGESLVDVFVRTSAHFAKLRNSTMRRVMSRLVTVEQAARMAHVPVQSLLDDLNGALCPSAHVHDYEPSRATPTAPPRKSDRHPQGANIVELDLREELRAGHEPFSRIMAVVGAASPNDVLALKTIFEPVPLLEVLAKRGFLHETVSYATDDWTTWFWRPESWTIRLDVRGLPPPEPLMRTLAALETLPAGYELIHVNSRVPQLLFPLLAERGFTCDVDDSGSDGVFVRIRRALETQS
jgi:hypothetical protein